MIMIIIFANKVSNSEEFRKREQLYQKSAWYSRAEYGVTYWSRVESSWWEGRLTTQSGCYGHVVPIEPRPWEVRRLVGPPARLVIDGGCHRGIGPRDEALASISHRPREIDRRVQYQRALNPPCPFKSAVWASISRSPYLVPRGVRWVRFIALLASLGRRELLGFG